MTTIMEQAAKLVAEERQRQVAVEGFDAAHDDQWVNGELASGAQAYLEIAVAQADQYYTTSPGPGQIEGVKFGLPNCFPVDVWSEYWWKPGPDRLRNLIKAAALLQAEIERELRSRGWGR